MYNYYGYGAGQYGYFYPQQDLIRDIEEYIHDEIKDSKYYAILSAKAPTQRAKDLLMEFSKDEAQHAKNLMEAYYMLTGVVYTPPAVEEPDVPDYDEALKVRILAETADYQKYGEKKFEANNPYLKHLFFNLRTVEAKHAMRIPLLMEEEVD